MKMLGEPATAARRVVASQGLTPVIDGFPLQHGHF
jgi:hypothetical protein